MKLVTLIALAFAGSGAVFLARNGQRPQEPAHTKFITLADEVKCTPDENRTSMRDFEIETDGFTELRAVVHVRSCEKSKNAKGTLKFGHRIDVGKAVTWVTLKETEFGIDGAGLAMTSTSTLKVNGPKTRLAVSLSGIEDCWLSLWVDVYLVR